MFHLGGYTIPKGATVMASFWHALRDPGANVIKLFTAAIYE
jgi:cytochrome P450